MISIIVPIYKVEDYLVACIKSILASTYKDFELILVDDGSPDNCGRICDEYAAKDSRIHVIHKKNGGLSDARNSGLNVAKGEYVSFVDSDDVIHPRMLEILHDAIKKDDYDFSMSLHQEVNNSEEIPLLSNPRYGFSYRHRELNQEECMYGLMSPAHADLKYNYVWNKLYKRSFIGDARFIDTAIEDMEFNNRLYLRMNKAVLVEAEHYYYVQRPSSLLHTGGDQRAANRLESFLLCLQEVPQKMLEARTKYLERLYDELFQTYYRLRNTCFWDRVIASKAKIFQDSEGEYWHSDVPILRKSVVLLCLKLPCCYSIFLKPYWKLKALICSCQKHNLLSK